MLKRAQNVGGCVLMTGFLGGGGIKSPPSLSRSQRFPWQGHRHTIQVKILKKGQLALSLWRGSQWRRDKISSIPMRVNTSLWQGTAMLKRDPKQTPLPVFGAIIVKVLKPKPMSVRQAVSFRRVLKWRRACGEGSFPNFLRECFNIINYMITHLLWIFYNTLALPMMDFAPTDFNRPLKQNLIQWKTQTFLKRE